MGIEDAYYTKHRMYFKGFIKSLTFVFDTE